MAAGPELLCAPGAVGRGVSPAFSARRCRGGQLGTKSRRARLSPLFPGYRAAAAGAKGASARRAFVPPVASPVVPRPAQPEGGGVGGALVLPRGLGGRMPAAVLPTEGREGLRGVRKPWRPRAVLPGRAQWFSKH